MSDLLKIQTDKEGLASEADVAGANQALEAAKAIQVTNAEEANEAGAFLKKCSTAKKALEERRKEITKPLDEAKKSVMDLFRGPFNTLEEARKTVKATLEDWTAAEERRLAEERRKAEEKARKERERAEAKAREYEEQGREDMAEKWESKAEEADAAVPAGNERPKVAGVSMRTTYDVQVNDPVEVCRAVAEGKLPPAVVSFNQGELNKFARAWKGKVDMPGCKIRVSKKAAG